MLFQNELKFNSFVEHYFKQMGNYSSRFTKSVLKTSFVVTKRIIVKKAIKGFTVKVKERRLALYHLSYRPTS